MQFSMGNKLNVTDRNNTQFIRIIMKNWCNVLQLCYKSSKLENTHCSLCNLKEESSKIKNHLPHSIRNQEAIFGQK